MRLKERNKACNNTHAFNYNTPLFEWNRLLLSLSFSVYGREERKREAGVKGGMFVRAFNRVNVC